MNIDEINKITQEASELKNKANSQVALFELYLEAQILYDEAYENCIKSSEISQIIKDFLSAIYRYESLDCQFAYSLKKKEFDKCQELSVQQLTTIDKVLNNYSISEIQDVRIRSWHKYLVDCRIAAETHKYFPIGKSYFDDKDFKKAIFYFRRTEEIYNTRKKEELKDDYLLNYFLNFYILKFNISQCQVGVLKTDKDLKEKDFLERQIIKELLQSFGYAEEVMKISSDETYKKGYSQINDLIKSLLNKSLNTWQTLYDYTHSEHLLNLMKELDSQKVNSINVIKLNPPPQKADYLLVYTHGFNTRGEWKNEFTTVITDNERNTNIHFILSPWDYGTFKLKFFINSCRRTAVKKFVKHYGDLLDLYGHSEQKCVVAHSFGTYIVGTAIQENENFICDRIVLVGNILDTEYDWDKLKNRNQIDKVFIEQSTNDSAVLLAMIFRKVFFQKWIGYAGRTGFSRTYSFMTKIESESGHSGMLNKQNMASKWFPFLVN
jgi:hypothetical protein